MTVRGTAPPGSVRSWRCSLGRRLPFSVEGCPEWGERGFVFLTEGQWS